MMKKTCVLSITILLTSGCALTDSLKQKLIDDDSAKSAEMLEAHKLDALSSEVDKMKELTPKLVRLIKMEEDLAFFIESVKTQNQNTGPSFSRTSSVSGLQANLDTVVQNQQSINLSPGPSFSTTPLMTHADIKDSTSSGTSSGINAEVELGVAPPIIANNSISEIENTDIDAKFSSMQPKQVTSSTLSQATISNDLTVDSKFALNKGQTVLKGANNDSDCMAAVADGKFSIHLASYTNIDTAKKGWDILSKKYEDTFCGLNPVLADVVVKNKKYMSLRLGPIADSSSAIAICKKVREQGDYCNQSQFEGQPL